MIRRRTFIGGLGALATCAPPRARAQTTVPVVGILGGPSPRARETLVYGALRQGLRETGFVEEHNVALLFRLAEDRYDQLPALAADLVDRKVSVIVAPAPTNAALAAKAATASIPIVFLTPSDPVAVGLVPNLKRPGGNITGVTFLTEQLNPKRLELLHQTVPTASTIGYLFNPATFDDGRIGRMQAAAQTLGIGLSIIYAATPNEIDMAFAEIARQRIGALFVDADPLFYTLLEQLVPLSARYGVPTIYQTREHVDAGGLMSYGANISDAFRLAGVYAGRILKGEKPAELPVQQPTRIELIINLKTAKALGLTFPLNLLGRADEVIE